MIAKAKNLPLSTQDLPVDKIDPSPENKSHGQKQIEQLASSIGSLGLLMPIRVRETTKGRFEIVTGERRFRAAQSLGWETIPAIIVNDPRQAAAERAAENLARVGYDLWEEVAVVADVQTANLEASKQQLAELLGQTPHWVATRIKLRDLPEKTRKTTTTWSTAAILELTKIPADHFQAFMQSESWLFGRTDPGAESVKSAIDRWSRSLKAARWKLSEGERPCTTCPSNSANQEFLWPGAKSSDARCTEPDCWSKKAAAFIDAETLKLKQKTDCDPIKITTHYGSGRPADAVSEYTYPDCRRDEPGATPAIFVDGPEAGKVIYVKPPKKPKTQSATNKQSASKTDKERFEAFQTRRRAKSIEWVCEQLENVDPTTIENLAAFTAAFGTRHNHNCKDPKSLAKSFQATREQLARNIWDQIFPVIQQRWKIYTITSDVPVIWQEVELLAPILSINLKTLEEETALAMPLPKSLQGYIAKSAGLKTKPVKQKPSKVDGKTAAVGS